MAYGQILGQTPQEAIHAKSASKLETERTILTNLASTEASLFDGTVNITPGVTGVLPISNGGTGVTTIDDLKSLLNVASYDSTTIQKENMYARLNVDNSVSDPVQSSIFAPNFEVVTWKYRVNSIDFSTGTNHGTGDEYDQSFFPSGTPTLNLNAETGVEYSLAKGNQSISLGEVVWNLNTSSSGNNRFYLVTEFNLVINNNTIYLQYGPSSHSVSGSYLGRIPNSYIVLSGDANISIWASSAN